MQGEKIPGLRQRRESGVDIDLGVHLDVHVNVGVRVRTIERQLESTGVQEALRYDLPAGADRRERLQESSHLRQEIGQGGQRQGVG